MPQGVYSTQLSMRSHVQQIVAGCFALLRQLCSIWRFVPSSSCMGLIDTRLRSAVRLISGCLQPARLSGCQCSAMLHLLIYVVGQQLTVCLRSSGPIRVGLCMLRWCLWASTSVACILAPSVVRHDICRHSCAVERGLVVGFRGQPHYCCRPRCLEARFCHAWSLGAMGSRPITFLWLWPATYYEPHCGHVPINKIWRWAESTPRSGWSSHTAEIYSDCSTREIANNLYIRLLSLLLFWLGWTTVMLLWQACQTIYSAVFSWSSTLQLGWSLVFNALITSQTLCMPVFTGYVFWVYQVQTGSPRLPSSARHSTPLSLWRTVLCRWYAGGREVVSGRRPPVSVTPQYCWRPFICHSCMSQDL